MEFSRVLIGCIAIVYTFDLLFMLTNVTWYIIKTYKKAIFYINLFLYKCREN